MRAVLDTNVIVSALISPRGNEAIVLLLALRGHYRICVSPEVLAEYHDVLGRPRFKKYGIGNLRAILSSIKSVGYTVHPHSALRISPDESDNRFYECAATANADYIVTGNTRHFPRKSGITEIATPRQFLEILR